MTKEEIIKKHLNNEKNLWEGAPEKIPFFNKSDIFLVPLTLIFGGMFIFYAIISIIMMVLGQGISFSFFGLTFLIIGIYFVFIRLWYRKKRISHEVYFVTERRVMAFDTLRDNVIFDVLLSDTDMYLGYKSLILSETNAIGDLVYNLGLDIFLRKFSHETPSFKYINDISDVFKIIQNAKSKAEVLKDEEIFI